MSDAPEPAPSDSAGGRWQAGTGSVAGLVDAGVFEVDGDGRVVAVNDVVADALGRGRDELAGLSASNLIADRDVDAFEEQLRALADRESVSLDVEVETADGEFVPVTVEMRPRVVNGERAGAVGVARGLDAERSFRQDVRNPGEQFRMLVESVEEYAIFLLDRDGHVVSWNAGAEQIKGYSADDILGEHFSTFYTAADREAGVPEENLRLAAEHGDVEDEGWRVRADGTEFWARVTITAIRGEDGSLRGFAKVTRDMTDRRAREERLRQERDMNERILEAFPESVVVLDEDWNVVRSNDRAKDRLGFESGDEYEVGERDVYDESGEFVPVEERPYVSAFETGERVDDWEAQVDLPDAGRRWVSISAVPIPGPDGDTEFVVVSSEDITERKRQERELRAELDEVFDRVSDAVFALNEDWQFTFVNEEAERVLDRSEGELLGETLWAEFPAAVDSTFQEQYERAMHEQESVVFEEYYPPLEAWFSVRAHPSETGLTVYFRDMTERKEREQELERVKERFRKVFERSHDAIYINDPRADEIVDVNPAGCEMLGYSREELLSMGPSDFHPDEMERFREFVNDVFESGRGWTDELTCLHRDGTRIPVEMSAARVDLSGRTVMLAIVRDISERKERERELERTERQFEATFDNPVSFMGLLDPDGSVRRINETALEFAGVTEDEVRGDLFWETPWFAHSDDSRALVRDGVERAANGEYVRSELTHVSPDGERVVIDAVLEPVRDDDGSVVSLLASGRDVTERERRERALRDAYEVIADAEKSFEEQVEELLEVGRETVGTDFATLSRIHDGEYVFESLEAPADAEVSAGDAVPLSDLPACERVFDTGESLAIGDVDADAPELADPEFGVSSYLGSPVVVGGDVYGTFCFYSMDAREAEFSEWEETFVDLLSDWVGYERERQRTAEQLAAVNELNDVVREITDAAISESERSEIESVACERLAASDSYEFAWIGEPDAASGEVTSRASANTAGYLDDISISLEDSAEREGPTARALRTGEVQTVHDVTEDDAFAPWREHADAYGFQSSAAIPVKHEEAVFAALNVYADREQAFTGEERVVLGHLGEIIGHAIAAVERKRTLMGDEVVELEFRIHDVFEALNVPAATTGTVTLDEAIPVGSSDFLMYGTLDESDVDVLEALTDELPHWESVTVLGNGEDARFELELADPPVLSAVASLGGTVEEAVFEDGDYRMRVRAPKSVEARHIVDAVQDAYPEAEVFAQRQLERVSEHTRDQAAGLTSELTDRQEEALKAAFFGGYFEWPREADGEDVAESLGISPPTFHQHLRAGERKILNEVLGGD